MKQGEHWLKEYWPGRGGVIARVVLTAAHAERFSIAFNTSDEWRWCWPAIEFGIRYADEQASLAKNKLAGSVRISVDEVLGSFIDTPQMALAYAAAMAFFDAVEIQPAMLPTYDSDTHLFTFQA